MAQYILKSALVSEVESEIKKLRSNLEIAETETDSKTINLFIGCYNRVLSILDVIDVKEEDLNEEIEKVSKRHNMLAVGKKDFTDIAKHFFELGMRVNNPVTAEDRGTAEEIIINLKQIEKEYQIDLTKEKNWVPNKVQKGE